MTVHVVLHFRQSPGWSETAEHYHVDVVRAPGSGWGGPLEAGGLDAGQVEAIHRLYAGYLRRRQAAAREALAWDDVEPLRAAGNQLFHSLPETVQQRLTQAQRRAHEQGEGLRLDLRFDPSARALLRLPWELLHQPERRTFFALQGEGLTRQLLLPGAAPLPASFRPRATLGLWAEPRDLQPLAERRAFAPAPGLDGDVTWVEGADSLARLQQALDAAPCDSLHVVAHGRGGEAWRDFSLAFEDAGRRAQWVGADRLATLLAAYPALRLVYLDVCASGEGIGSFTPGGLAVDLLQASVPSVVVMQHDVAQQAAGLLAYHFYRALARGETMAAALARGRRAVRVEQDDPVHWSVPALYLRQSLPPPADEGDRAADWLLDRLAPTHVTRFLTMLSLFLLVAHLSFAFAGAAPGLVTVALLVQSVLLPALGALLMRKGHQRLAEEAGLQGRAWLPALQDKYFGAAVWALFCWLVVAVAGMGLVWGGLWPRLGAGGRQALWAVALLSVAAAGYVGGRQGLRQHRLFHRNQKATHRPRTWLLSLLLLFLPAIGYTFTRSLMDYRPLWGPAGFWVALAFLLFLAALTSRLDGKP